MSFSTYSSHAAVVPTRLLMAHPPVPGLGTYTRCRWSIIFWYTGLRWSIFYWNTGWRWSILYSGDVGVEHRSLETVWVDMWLSFPFSYSSVSHTIFNSCQHFTLSLSAYSSHAAVVPTRLLIAHPPTPALGTYTRWRWSILYWYTGWRWSIHYSDDVGVEHRSLETVWVDMWLSFPYAYSMHFTFDF